MATPKSPVRIGEAERAAAQRALQEHLNAGRLQVTEYADRAAAAAGAVTAPEIAALFTDLPAPRPKLPGSPLAGAGRTLAIVGGVVVLALGGLLAFVLGRGGDPAPAVSAAPVPVATPSAAPPIARVVPSSAARVTQSAGAGASAPALPGATVRRTTGAEAITLRPSYGVDLDNDLSPNWDVAQYCCSRDVGWSGDGTVLYISGDFAVMTGPADYATCSRETGYTSGRIERGSLQPDQSICVRTSSDRYAVVTIVDVSDQAVRFRATVWDPPISR